MTGSLANLLLIKRGARVAAVRASSPMNSHGLVSPDLFRRMLFIERKRSERSGKGFVLMLLRSAKLLKPGTGEDARNRVVAALSHATRDTDLKGWYEQDSTLGVIFTELGDQADGHTVAKALLNKTADALSSVLSINEINEIRISFSVFPEGGKRDGKVDEFEARLYDELFGTAGQGRFAHWVKRSIDVAGSLLAMAIGMPLFAGIALAVKLTSPGPVLFRQQRVGQYGRPFTFLKFRSMHCNTDHRIHEQFVKQFIANGNHAGGSAKSQAPYKLTVDPRITRVGRFLRQTSLDELPQFMNVLIGDMSLVGPRPPLPYEVESYHAWHKARVLAAKPGITGLWQVEGRSRVKFDDMVRMDLRYASSWSIWLDMKILLRTPYAVLSASGAR